MYNRRAKKTVESERKTALTGTMPPGTRSSSIELAVMPGGGATAPTVVWFIPRSDVGRLEGAG